MRVSNNQTAPNFFAPDVNGNRISLQDFKGKKVHLAFYRFSGCPFCNLRFHEIQKLEELYKKNNTILISIYESSAENMRAHIGTERFYSIMIPNPDSSLYKLYSLGKSLFGLLIFTVFKGGISKSLRGQKLFTQNVTSDGEASRIEAEFLIDKKGVIVNAHYNAIQGDYLPIHVIKKFIEG